MKRPYSLLIAAMICLVPVSSSYAGSSELLQLLVNKEFWSTFKWEKFEESELYKATEWRPPGWPKTGGNVTRTNTYTIDISIDELNINKMTIYERSDAKGLLSIYGTPPYDSYEYYNKLVDWCNDKFGDATVRDEQTETISNNNSDTTESSWSIGNTVVKVKRQTHCFTTADYCRTTIKLGFNRNYNIGK